MFLHFFKHLYQLKLIRKCLHMNRHNYSRLLMDYLWRLSRFSILLQFHHLQMELILTNLVLPNIHYYNLIDSKRSVCFHIIVSWFAVDANVCCISIFYTLTEGNWVWAYFSLSHKRSWDRCFFATSITIVTCWWTTLNFSILEKVQIVFRKVSSFIEIRYWDRNFSHFF